MNGAAVPKKPAGVIENLAVSQYREESLEFANDPHTFISYPVFDSFEKDR